MIELRQLAAGRLFEPASAPPVVRFAADELDHYLERICGVRPQRRQSERSGDAWLFLSATDVTAAEPLVVPPDAESVVVPSAQALAFAGRDARALLAAVYAWLEALGCRWSPQGRAAEHVPSVSAVRRGATPLVVRPAFARRVFTSDLGTFHYAMPERLQARRAADAAFVDWMVKAGTTGFSFIRHANDTQWLVPDLAADCARRGLGIEAGGHVLVELLPRSLFGAQPELFPLAADGQRTDLGNMCTANARALAIVGEHARRALSELPPAPFHLWGLDVLGGGWCHCAGCASLSPSDQAVRVCNAVGEGVPAGAPLFHLAYHDTLAVPTRVRPHPRVRVEFAPRERCYGHSLDDPRCEINAPFRDALAQHLEWFDGRVDVFEYYADTILFGGCAVPLVDVIAQDLAYYRRQGVQGVSCLTFGRYSLWAHGPNLLAFARGSQEPRRVAGAREEHCEGVYGGAATAMARYWAQLERAMANVVQFGDLKLPPPDAARGRQALAQTIAELPATESLLVAAAASLSAERHAAERHLLAYTRDTLTALHDWLHAVHVRDASRTTAARRAFDAALAHVEAVTLDVKGTWGAFDLEIAHAFFQAALSAGGSAD